MRVYIAIISALFLVGCSTTYPAITEYKIAVDSNVSKVQSSCKQNSLTVAQVFVKSSLMKKDMKYVVGKYQEFAYNQAAWAQTPNRAITDALVSTLQHEHIFTSVQSYKSFSHSEYTLESRVNDFMQYFNKDEKESHAIVDITFTLIDNATAEVVATKEIRKVKKTENVDAQSGVKALNELLTQTLREMSGWLAGSCS